jgi:hypothetical protein
MSWKPVHFKNILHKQKKFSGQRIYFFLWVVEGGGIKKSYLHTYRMNLGSNN